MTKALASLRGNLGALPAIEEAINLLVKSEFIDFLKDQARPYIVNGGADVNVMASQAAYSAGYHECIDDIINFKKKYILDEKTARAGIIADYGGTQRALKQGYITEEDLDEFRKHFSK
jgi:hypothetical protein